MPSWLKSVMLIVFGVDWKSSLIGMGGAAAAGAVAYASGHAEPGFYVLALAVGALARYLVSATTRAKLPKP